MSEYQDDLDFLTERFVSDVCNVVEDRSIEFTARGISQMKKQLSSLVKEWEDDE